MQKELVIVLTTWSSTTISDNHQMSSGIYNIHKKKSMYPGQEKEQRVEPKEQIAVEVIILMQIERHVL